MADFFNFFIEVFPTLLSGTKVTLNVAVVALGLGFALGLPIALLRVYGPSWLHRLLGIYISFFRGVPLLVQLFIVYFGLPKFGITFSRMTAAYITLGLNSSAYQAEYFRGALQSVGRGQMIAARAIGMSQAKAVRHIILPQAVRLCIPAWSNEMIAMIKYTAVIFLIAVPDLMGQGKIIASRHFAPIETYTIVALFYLVLVGAFSLVLHVIDQKLATPGLAMDIKER